MVKEAKEATVPKIDYYFCDNPFFISTINLIHHGWGKRVAKWISKDLFEMDSVEIGVQHSPYDR